MRRRVMLTPALWTAIDVHRRGVATRRQMVQGIHSALGFALSTTEAAALFAYLDDDADGRIARSDLRKLLPAGRSGGGGKRISTRRSDGVRRKENAAAANAVGNAGTPPSSPQPRSVPRPHPMSRRPNVSAAAVVTPLDWASPAADLTALLASRSAVAVTSSWRRRREQEDEDEETAVERLPGDDEVLQMEERLELLFAQATAAEQYPSDTIAGGQPMAAAEAFDLSLSMSSDEQLTPEKTKTERATSASASSPLASASASFEASSPLSEVRRELVALRAQIDSATAAATAPITPATSVAVVSVGGASLVQPIVENCEPLPPSLIIDAAAVDDFENALAKENTTRSMTTMTPAKRCGLWFGRDAADMLSPVRGRSFGAELTNSPHISVSVSTLGGRKSSVLSTSVQHCSDGNAALRSTKVSSSFSTTTSKISSTRKKKKKKKKKKKMMMMTTAATATATTTKQTKQTKQKKQKKKQKRAAMLDKENAKATPLSAVVPSSTKSSTKSKTKTKRTLSSKRTPGVSAQRALSLGGGAGAREKEMRKKQKATRKAARSLLSLKEARYAGPKVAALRHIGVLSHQGRQQRLHMYRRVRIAKSSSSKRRSRSRGTKSSRSWSGSDDLLPSALCHTTSPTAKKLLHQTSFMHNMHNFVALSPWNSPAERTPGEKAYDSDDSAERDAELSRAVRSIAIGVSPGDVYGSGTRSTSSSSFSPFALRLDERESSNKSIVGKSTEKSAESAAERPSDESAAAAVLPPCPPLILPPKRRNAGWRRNAVVSAKRRAKQQQPKRKAPAPPRSRRRRAKVLNMSTKAAAAPAANHSSPPPRAAVRSRAQGAADAPRTPPMRVVRKAKASSIASASASARSVVEALSAVPIATAARDIHVHIHVNEGQAEQDAVSCGVDTRGAAASATPEATPRTAARRRFDAIEPSRLQSFFVQACARAERNFPEEAEAPAAACDAPSCFAVGVAPPAAVAAAAAVLAPSASATPSAAASASAGTAAATATATVVSPAAAQAEALRRCIAQVQQVAQLLRP